MNLLNDYSYLLVFLIVGVGFVLFNTLLPHLLSKKSQGKYVGTTYESGETPIGDAWIKFDILYYLYALIFIAFDVEAIFLFPVLIAYKTFPGMLAFIEVTLFLVILSGGIIYAWKKGIFAWR